ncbi:sensor histidine kinase [Candidatus Contubernalis alkaliaceticus]|uniref:sensor histidine kinase n=1 Tax=Candidatus Contubernalis alkaliaceticus TaxID=338645 RepID=UPI001F4BED99|nr:HAMP domain-containing sensor histidine kinase [Candidatus Contubernalis alkalaceticus]UNC91993.1 HAMP domain-containing histidine kinase [Candidatus Contubernalis alkalaceticus]
MRLIAILSGTAAALGAYLFCFGTGATRWIGLGVLVAGAAASVLCICMGRQQEKKIYNMHEQIMGFLQGRIETPIFSVDDDMFALLENSVVELENRLLLEHHNTQKSCQKNADFITDVSHQLKTPLTALKLYCEMDNNNNRSQHLPKQLVLIERMEHLIYSLLRLEKLRADTYEMQYSQQDLFQLSQQVWEELQILYPEKTYRVTGSAAMRCDEYWMGEALKNILKNSCEHTEPEGRIQVSLETTDTSVNVTVEDNGGGIPEDELLKIFQRFYRSSRAPSNEGVGIGLAITRAIVEKHHGTIYAENTKQGLKVILCFPILEGVLAIG